MNYLMYDKNTDINLSQKLTGEIVREIIFWELVPTHYIIYKSIYNF